MSFTKANNMKVTISVIFAMTCLASVSSFPAQPEDKKAGVGVVPLEQQKKVTLEDIEKETAYGGDQSIVDTGYFSYGNPFDGLLQSFESIVNNMRRQMAQLLGNLGPDSNSTKIDFGFPPAPFIPNIDLEKGNTTSVTKIIDGHKVVINETEYKDEGENGGAYFKVRIIDVKPDSSEFTTEGEAERVTNEPTDRESVELNSSENEITKVNEKRGSSQMETIEEFDFGRPYRRNEPYGNYFNYWDDLEPLYPVDSNDIDFVPAPIDLSRDTYVNQLLAESGAPTNPDAEVFDILPDNQHNMPLQRMSAQQSMPLQRMSEQPSMPSKHHNTR